MTLAAIATLLAVFVVGKRIGSTSPTSTPTRPRMTGRPGAPARPVTIAQIVVQQHPRLEYGVRRRLVHDHAPDRMQEFTAAAIVALLERLATASLYEFQTDEPDAMFYKLGPLGAAGSALDAMRAAHAKGAHVFLTLAAAFELVACVPSGPVALVAVSAPSVPRPDLTRSLYFARLPRSATAPVVARTPAPPPARVELEPGTTGVAGAPLNGVGKHAPEPTPATAPPTFEG